jgi:hypothetical protein
MYNGKAIGNANNNNARRINDVALTVSNYYSTRPPTQRPTLRPTAVSPPATQVYFFIVVHPFSLIKCSPRFPLKDYDPSSE